MGGIMEEIRKKLAEGATAQELIDRGYKSGSVFKAQWQLRKRKGPETEPIETVAQLLARFEQSELEELRRELESANDIIEILSDELKQRQITIRDLSKRVEELRWAAESTGDTVETLSDLVAERDRTIRELNERIRVLEEEDGNLRRFETWSGHQCVVCHRPMDGVPERDTAAKILAKAGHRKCLNEAGLRSLSAVDLVDLAWGPKSTGTI